MEERKEDEKDAKLRLKIWKENEEREKQLKEQKEKERIRNNGCQLCDCERYSYYETRVAPGGTIFNYREYCRCNHQSREHGEYGQI